VYVCAFLKKSSFFLSQKFNAGMKYILQQRGKKKQTRE